MRSFLTGIGVVICYAFAISGIKVMNLPVFVTVILVTIFVALAIWFLVLAVSKGDRKDPLSERTFLSLIKSFVHK